MEDGGGMHLQKMDLYFFFCPGADSGFKKQAGIYPVKCDLFLKAL